MADWQLEDAIITGNIGHFAHRIDQNGTAMAASPVFDDLDSESRVNPVIRAHLLDVVQDEDIVVFLRKRKNGPLDPSLRS